MAQPPAKRLRMTVSIGGGNEAAAAAVPESPGSRKLWQTLLVVLFLVRVLCVQQREEQGDGQPLPDWTHGSETSQGSESYYEDASLDFSVHLESGSGTQYPTTANDITDSLTLHCPSTTSNEIAGSVAVDQAALAMGHGAYEMPFANRDTPVLPLFQQEQPLPAQHDAPSCPLNAAPDTCVLSRDSSFRPSNFGELFEHWVQNQISEDWLGDSVDTFSAPNANGLPADVHCNVAKLLSHRKWIKLVALVRWLSMLRASSRSREEHA